MVYLQKLEDVVNKFSAYFAGLERFRDTIDMSGDIIYGVDTSTNTPYNYIAIPLRSMVNCGIDKDGIDKLFGMMAFFVDNVMASGNIYLTNRKDKLVIEIAWSVLHL